MFIYMLDKYHLSLPITKNHTYLCCRTLRIIYSLYIYILTISSYIIIIQLQTRQFMNKTTPTHRHIVTRHLFNLRWAKLRTSHQAPAAASKEPWSCGLVFLGQRHVDPSTMEIHSAIHIGRSQGVVDQLFFSLK